MYLCITSDPTTVRLSSLAVSATEKILAGALNMKDDTGNQPLRSLTTAVQAKTDGNPLFVTRFLAQLHQAGIIKWNWTRVGWEWDLPAVNSAHFLVDTEHWLSASQLLRITPELQRMLQVAAVAGGALPVKVLVELAHLFLEELPTSERDNEGSVGGDSGGDEDEYPNGGSEKEPSHIHKISPIPLRRSGPPSLTPVSSVASSPATSIRQSSNPGTPSSIASAPSTPQISSKPPSQQHAERGSTTPSQIDSLVQRFPNTNVSYKSTTTKPPTITPPATPPTSPPTLPRFSLMSPTKHTDPLQKQPHKVRRMDSFPRVQAMEDLLPSTDSQRTISPRYSKLQRSLGSQQFATSPPDLNVINRRLSADYQPVPIDTKITPIKVDTEAMNITSPTNNLPSPMALTSPKFGSAPGFSSPLTIFPDSPALSSSLPAPHSPTEVDDSAWAHFPKREDSTGAIFRITSHILNRPSVLKNGNMEMSSKNKKYSTIVSMLINEAVTSSLLKETQEPNMHGGMFAYLLFFIQYLVLNITYTQKLNFVLTLLTNDSANLRCCKFPASFPVKSIWNMEI